MNLQTNLLFILLLLLSVVAQCIFGNFPFAFFAFPLDVLLALIWMGGMGYVYKEKRSSRFVRLWLSPQCTYWTLGWLLAGCLVIGSAFRSGNSREIRSIRSFGMLSFYFFLDFCSGAVRIAYTFGNDYPEESILAGTKPMAFCT